MKLLIVAVGQRVPDWAQTAYDDYAKRFPPELKVELKAVKTEPRGSKTLETLYAAERERIEAAIPRGTRVVVLDERGQMLSSPEFAQKIAGWRDQARDVAFVIGSADGIDPSLRDRADLAISLGRMVWPHMLVRVMLAEQLYRAANILAGGPYHRA